VPTCKRSLDAQSQVQKRPKVDVRNILKSKVFLHT